MVKNVVIVHTLNGETYATFIRKEVNLLGTECFTVNMLQLMDLLNSELCSPEKTLVHYRTGGLLPNIQARNVTYRGFRVINSAETLKRTSDKFLSCVWAEEKDVNVPKTIKCKRGEVVGEIRGSWQGKQLVIKPINSKAQGAYCFRSASDDPELEDKVARIPGNSLVVQEYVDYKRIFRVVVVGGKALERAVFMDEPTPEDWKVSVCLNPQAKWVENPDPALLTYAIKIAAVFETEVGFIDVFETDQGYVLSEVNTACSLIEHERKSGFNVSGEIAKYLVSQL